MSEYRDLKVGEVIRGGDECMDTQFKGLFKEVPYSYIGVCIPNTTMVYRRATQTSDPHIKKIEFISGEIVVTSESLVTSFDVDVLKGMIVMAGLELAEDVIENGRLG